MTTLQRFAECCPSFQEDVKNLAAQHGKTVEQVYGWWREYSADCDAYDQSAIMGEFEQWYMAKLIG